MTIHSGTLAGKYHGQRNLVSYSPKGHKEFDTSKQLNNNDTEYIEITYVGIIFNNSEFSRNAIII